MEIYETRKILQKRRKPIQNQIEEFDLHEILTEDQCDALFGKR